MRSPARPRVIAYPLPPTEPSPHGVAPSSDYTIEVGGTAVPVYAAKVVSNGSVTTESILTGKPVATAIDTASFAWFDAAYPVVVTVRPARPFERVTVRPSSYGIEPEVRNGEMRFRLDRPRKLSIELDGETDRPLLLFAGEPEADAPSPDDADVVYFGPGVHEAGEIRPASGQTVYLAGGAVVRGVISVTDAENVAIRGRGVLDASGIERHEHNHVIGLKNCRNCCMEGIVVYDSPLWTVVPWKCEGLMIRDLRLLGNWRPNSDGIDVVCSRDVTIEDCFIRAFDDCIALKGCSYGYDCGRAPVENVLVRGCVIWCDLASAFEIGVETQTEAVRNIRYTDCDIIHVMHDEYWSAMSIHNGDAAEISDVRYEDVRVEDCRARLLHVAIREFWAVKKDRGFGPIRDVTLRNVSVLTGPQPWCEITGFDGEHAVERVTFDNVRILGRKVDAPADLGLRTNEHVRDVRFV